MANTENLSSDLRPPRVGSFFCWALAVVSIATAPGCRGADWVRLREDPRQSWFNSVPLVAKSRPEPSERTMLLLRRYDLADAVDGDPHDLLARLQNLIEREPSSDKLYAYAEMAYLAAWELEPDDEKESFDLYAAAVANAYLYLFDPRFEPGRNAYDPQFRGACDLYNKSLDRALRLVNKYSGLRPGLKHECRAGDHILDFEIVCSCEHLRGHDFDRFEFVSDYEINGLPNRYLTYGLGVPLIAVRKDQSENGGPIEKHYPPRLSVPMTAFLRIMPSPAGGGPPRRRAVLELHDPLTSAQVVVAGRPVPLESDSTTPLAYFLNSLEYTDVSVATQGLFRPAESPHSGLFMLEPYQPGKIPVILVHGLWSSPITWVEMFNDLRSIPEIRQHYQFWFYAYPTGQTFIYSASQLRDQLAEIRNILDPQHRQPALDQLVLVGHSMGGLISRLQTVESGDVFWKQVANQPVDAIQDQETRQALHKRYFFRPNPSIRRVVTIATPYRGSLLSNSATQWLGRKLISLPPTITRVGEQLRLNHPELLRQNARLTSTSIEMLADDSPALQALMAARPAPWVSYHNVIGKTPSKQWLGKAAGDSDGVVTVASARSPDSVSEVIVPVHHRQVHRHPRTVLEVRRILLDHLRMLYAPTNQPAAVQTQYLPQH